ncbi:peptidyl-tRNA hydrolase [Planctomyces bekefii]|uniref:Peptidyl-tRNA hydrolase n=1 Tax=Planctomyces bekefii TaxID=1653850 RepID=A0A5C6M4R5_9PLAN|nr:peptidyl-tRNA hydrolase [Planctomyces bekefii]
MKLLVGLGNPGPKYETTRHNAGFLVLDLLAEDAKLAWDEGAQGRFGGDIAKGSILGESCVLLKPMTYMNRSGRSVTEVMRFFKIDIRDVVVIHDDIDVPAGKVKARDGGSHGGHNGIRSIIDESGQSEFHRIKLGFGRPPEKWDPADWLLSQMTNEELLAIQSEMLKEVYDRLKHIFLRKAS